MVLFPSYPGVILFLLLGASASVLLAAWRKLSRVYLPSFSRLRGPPTRSWIYGNIEQFTVENMATALHWFEKYGLNVRVRGLFLRPVLYTTDPRVINHVLTHSMDYHKIASTRRGLERILGRGLVVAEGERHREQRRVMNPAFGPAQIRELTGIFLAKAMSLCEFWDSQIGSGNTVVRVNVIDGLSKMTLDVIALAGFDYDTDALNTGKPPNELNEAFQQIFKKNPAISVTLIFSNLIPKYLRNKWQYKVDEAQATLQRIARQLMQERKAEIMRTSGEKSDTIDKKHVQGRDLLTLLMKANMATDIPESQCMTDDEVLAQVPTFMIAGHETTSTATVWCLYALSRAPHIQDELRTELLTVPTDSPSMDTLVALPYLDRVVRETLRLYAPIAVTSRVAQRADILPISEPFVDRHGNMVHELPVRPGDRLVIPIFAINRSKRIWGEDADEFKPERWDNPPEAATAIPGVWGNMLTFLGGPHACIGYRFTLVEMKALVFTLVRTFRFEPAFPAGDVYVQGTFVQRPALQSEKDKGAQLPLFIRRLKHA